MRKVAFMVLASLVVVTVGCSERKVNSETILQKQTEVSMSEANKQIGMPAIVNFRERKNLKWIYELCDQEDLVCHAYLVNEMTGSVGQYLGPCIGYGIPYSAQFTSPTKLVDAHDYFSVSSFQAINVPQPEPNGIYKPEGLDATWLKMVDPETKEIRPVYIEPKIIVSPFKLH